MSGVRVLVSGCAGRMGRAVITELQHKDGVSLAGGMDRGDCPERGRDLGALIGADDFGLSVLADLAADLDDADVVIDFTAPEASVSLAQKCAEAGVALVIGTTGFTHEQDAAIARAAERIAIVKSGNMSLGVNLLSALVEQAAAVLGPDYDIEILEAHHRRKVDAPSGTALLLGEAAAKGRGADLSKAAVRVRDGQTGPRNSGDIGFAVLRAGGIVGEHSVLFGGEQEVITLSHQALDRALFARGAVAAAKWAAGRKPGLYAMRDVLGV